MYMLYEEEVFDDSIAIRFASKSHRSVDRDLEEADEDLAHTLR